MMKTFKHKALGWFTKPAKIGTETLEGKYDIFSHQDSSYINNHCMTEKELIALGFEEVIEKDWIENFFEERSETELTQDTVRGLFREIIEKHAPKQKKFTREEVLNRYSVTYFNGKFEDYIITFLKEHNLLSSD